MERARTHHRPVSEQSARAARRAYIAANHPDRGGDPASFIQGLRQLEQQQLEQHADGPGSADRKLRVYRSRRISLARWVRRWRSARRYGSRTLL